MVTGAVVVGGIWCWNSMHEAEIDHPAGVLVRTMPLEFLSERGLLTQSGGWSLTRVGTLQIHGRVLAVHRYHDDYASLSPLDILLGWGAMSDTANLSQLNISQNGRMRFIETGGKSALSETEIEHSTRHSHAITADVGIATVLQKLKVGELIQLHGVLVDADKEGRRWRSSLGKFDSGAAAGELLYITYVASLDKNAEPSASDGEIESLTKWYEQLAQRRRNLDVRDQPAVHAFNEEARRYMEKAHPEAHPEKRLPGGPSPKILPHLGGP